MDKPTIAILGGTGKEGPGLAMRWAHAGYKVLIGSRQAEKAEATAEELNEKLGIDSIEGYVNEEAAKLSDISVLTVVQAAHQPALLGLKEALQGKILVDATARVEFRDPKPPTQPSAGRIGQEILGEGVRVVAAFQNVPASALKKNLDQPVKTDVLICSDDVDAAEQVVGLAEAGGMTAYFAGGLDNAVVVEGITALLIAMNKHYSGHGTVQITGISKE
ncbi:MAG: NADPH-dependent F420 reductase [Chloroflexi bacterium]|jgi:8-hydroxy-5-deazaflavin:NADPH oxidoreductase|nr:NADPH-dependent F420 reductase [Chloroflexota bacterium]MBT3670746.1 NADPH-dependent F420 reductase [Chloroflexota bacterium]MBT4305114.1 NADPH-dependent F420 reductase [Chloroflexota bacterium]MBT4533364.1 NADPH-dependent F420 reductase [Chloroflexota bacterium]MBT4682880.1 NADPH-dependent F420 reductase [Chloroflexota bacterium]